MQANQKNLSNQDLGFRLYSEYRPAGDQPQAIKKVTEEILSGKKYMTLLGVTGSGKTFTMANVIQNVQKPTLIISHNKTLAAQLYNELKKFFPNNAVEYFISYYDYYQPEAYIPQTDTYIEKDASINEEIERLRLAATSSLLSRSDVIVVASVSCIYGLGSPEDYEEMVVKISLGQKKERSEILRGLVDIQYERNEYQLMPGAFRVRGDTIELYPAYGSVAYRIELFGDQVEAMAQIEPTTGRIISKVRDIYIYPAKHFVSPYSKLESAMAKIEAEMKERIEYFRKKEKYLEAQRIESKVRFDMEMLREIGYCQGIENYSRHLSGRHEGERPACLIDFFPRDLLVIVDESHVTLPQIRGMYNGDRARKETLVEFGFRLPSALDNRPLKFEEFERIVPQIVFVSATPGPYEMGKYPNPIEQVIRPTGLLDPPVSIRPLKNQVDDLICQIRERVKKKERVLVITLTKKMSEDLSEYLRDLNVRVRYIHSEIDAIERVDILRGLRKADYDVLIGINLLREGLDLPEVSLVAVLDADKEGFLRSQTSLIQIAGRAARHEFGEVILYADKVTDSMQRMIEETNRRRKIQMEYNSKNNITPRGIKRALDDSLSEYKEAKEFILKVSKKNETDYIKSEFLYDLEAEMNEAADKMDFEKAAMIRDRIYELQKESPNLKSAKKDKRK